MYLYHSAESGVKSEMDASVVNSIVADSAQPDEVACLVVSAPRAVATMVSIGARTELAQLARLPDVLEPETRERVRIAYALSRLRIRSQRSAPGRA